MTTEEIPPIALAGLREDILRDFLASLGLLDWLTGLFPERNPKLSWNTSSGHPRIHLSSPLPPDWAEHIIAAIQAFRSREPNPLGQGKIEAITPSRLREWFLQNGSDDRVLRFLCGLGSQLNHEFSGRRSELIIESASRSVLTGVDVLMVDRRNPIDLAGDLFGVGPKREVSNTSRWHPAEYQPAAHVATDPQFNKHRDWVGLNVLALFGTAFYPVVDTPCGRATSGFRRINRVNEFSWPIWAHPLAQDELRSLVTHPFCHSDPPDNPGLRAIGIERVWRSRKFKPDGNNDYFSTAMPT
jgi:hypothetical protein